MDNINLLDLLYRFILVPVVYFIWWLFRKYDKRIDELESRINKIERETAVLENKIDSLKEGIDDIKSQLNRLFNLLTTREPRG